MTQATAASVPNCAVLPATDLRLLLEATVDIGPFLPSTGSLEPSDHRTEGDAVARTPDPIRNRASWPRASETRYGRTDPRCSRRRPSPAAGSPLCASAASD